MQAGITIQHLLYLLGLGSRLLISRLLAYIHSAWPRVHPATMLSEGLRSGHADFRSVCRAFLSSEGEGGRTCDSFVYLPESCTTNLRRCHCNLLIRVGGAPIGILLTRHKL